MTKPASPEQYADVTSAIKVVTVVALAIGAGTVAVIESPASPPPPMSAGPIAHVEPWELAQASSAPTVEPREADLIAAAWAALSDRDAARALELAMCDAREHPHGVLSEECAAITIVALAHLDRMPEAAAAADRFKQDYPDSIHSDLVANALAGDKP